MATYIAKTNIYSGSGESSPVTLKIRVTTQALIRKVELIECNTQLKAWQLLNLLDQVMPKHIHGHTDQLKVHLEKKGGKICLVVTQISNGGEKYYRLNKYVKPTWVLSVHPPHLRAIMYWWRTNEIQYIKNFYKWDVCKVED